MKKILLIALVIAQTSFAQRTILHCGKLIDVKQLQVQSEMSVVIEGNKITDVQKGYITASAGDKVIELKNKTVMPGLIDCHVHIEQEISPNRLLKSLTQNEADLAFESLQYARITLLAGFTTVRDAGGSGVNIALRNAINKGLVLGPRVFTAGRTLSTTGGHGDPTNGLRTDLM